VAAGDGGHGQVDHQQGELLDGFLIGHRVVHRGALPNALPGLAGKSSGGGSGRGDGVDENASLAVLERHGAGHGQHRGLGDHVGQIAAARLADGGGIRDVDDVPAARHQGAINCDGQNVPRMCDPMLSRHSRSRTSSIPTGW